MTTAGPRRPSPARPPALREAAPADIADICDVINDGASAYQGVIPGDRWREPYMPVRELESEVAAGVRFWCSSEDGCMLGVMGVQDKGPVVLVRHAYVRTAARRRGIGTALLNRLTRTTDKPILVGTWKAAHWAIAFYRKHGFEVLPAPHAQELLRQYWSVPARQMAASVVLADRRYVALAEQPGRSGG